MDKQCVRCKRTFSDDRRKVCENCRPSCDRCGVELITNVTITGRAATRKKCNSCAKICRMCDVAEADTRANRRYCTGCLPNCPKCKLPSDYYKGDGVIKTCSACAWSERKKVEQEARDRLGNKCDRCGITHPLQWDHVNNDPVRPTIARRKRGSTLQTEYPEIRKIVETGRSDRLQLLCPNCNFLKEFDPIEYAKEPSYGPR